MLDIDQISDLVPPSSSKIVNLLHLLDDNDEPIVISTNGKADIAISDEGSFQMLVDLVDRLKLLEALRLATKDLDDGKGLSMDEVKEQVRVKYGLSI